MTVRDTLEESLRHLEYEMAMIVATPRMLSQHGLPPAKNTERPDGYYWANGLAVVYLAAMESNLVNARLLDDFFRYATDAVPAAAINANDRYAAEYCMQLSTGSCLISPRFGGRVGDIPSGNLLNRASRRD